MKPVPLRYLRLLRLVWLNPSCAEAHAALHAFERAHLDDVGDWMKRSDDKPMLSEEELSIVLQTIDYFAGFPSKYRRVTVTDAQIREMFGRPEATS